MMAGLISIISVRMRLTGQIMSKDKFLYWFLTKIVTK